MNNKHLNIGLFGFGVVGESLWKVLQSNTSLHATIKKVCIKHPNKARSAPAELFTTDPQQILADGQINVIVELIDDAEAAYTIVSTALRTGRSVVTANKKMVAEHLPELLELQQRTGNSLLYEAACCASIPIIRNLEEYYDNDLLQGVTGIVNGSTNYILSQMAEKGLSFDKALQQAQEAGFAERDPALDIEGIDAANKLSILLTHAYGIIQPPGQLLRAGITRLQPTDQQYAAEKGYRIKLVAHAIKCDDDTVAAFVLPQFVPAQDRLYHVSNEFNGVVIESALADRQFFNGKGAGGFPTASAVISDLSALRYGYKYEYKKLHNERNCTPATDFLLRVYCSISNQEQELPLAHWETIDEWNCSGSHTTLIGTLKYTDLVGSTWWRANGISLIAMPQPIVTGDTLQLRPTALRLRQPFVV
jgi:homoserine dehydrogenase